MVVAAPSYIGKDKSHMSRMVQVPAVRHPTLDR
jgi:hypothetical protein